MPWPVVILFCLTLGLAPFNPPHVVQKFQMLLKGLLVTPLDWFDLVLHSIPWVILILKALFSMQRT
jgi:hypothetical protein